MPSGIDFTEDAAPATPSTGKVTVYAKTDGLVYSKDDTGTEKAMSHNSKLNVSTANVTNPPTDAELDSAFGTPATVGAGFSAIVNDNNAATAVYFVTSDGTNWWYQLLTKAV